MRARTGAHATQSCQLDIFDIYGVLYMGLLFVLSRLQVYIYRHFNKSETEVSSAGARGAQ